MRVFILCPANIATGGTELLHQFSKCLSDCGIENYMIYPTSDRIQCPTPQTFLKYGVKYVSQYVDASDSVLVLAETQIQFIDICKKGRVMIWWLSVDNYFYAYRKRIQEDNPDIFQLSTRKNLLHFVQSYYAKDFVNRYINTESCYFLMDYISDEIVLYAQDNKDRYERKNVCLYNPKKGYEKLKPIIDACREDIVWLPLINMTPTEMADTMCQAKLYIDFGHHPGKDRIPREAAICGCCILTNREGSAAYAEDVAMPEQYRIEDISDTSEVLAQIYNLVDHYEERIGEYASYRAKILGEKDEFLQDLNNAVRMLKENAQTNVSQVVQENMEQYVGVLDSISQAASKVCELAENSKELCREGDLSEAMNKLLTMDYVLQMIREAAYAELLDMSQ